MNGVEQAKSSAHRLFAMASEARTQGHHGWADALTSLASELLEQASAMEAPFRDAPTTLPMPPSGAR
jgi:hypothetical protein